MILISYGTRPEWIKLSPVLDKIEVDHRVLFTGQHEDIAGGRYDQCISFRDDPALNRLDNAFISILLEGGYDIFDGVEHVMVQGDTASAAAVALAAFNRKLPVVHLEAGLRTHDNKNPYPEEVYRRMISSIASVHLCPTIYNAQNLKEELGGAYGTVHVVGNTVCDNLVNLKTDEYNNEVIVTMHRRENHARMDEWFAAINAQAAANKDLNFTLPIHPNPDVSKHRHLLTDVNVVDPIPYDEFIARLSVCRFIISDSGGIQEEAAFLHRMCIVCRERTERPEGLGVYSKLCETPERLPFVFESVRKNYKPSIKDACPYGDGHASRRVAEILNDL